jgi:hypothetical protein
VKAGAPFPEHSHPHEQISNSLEGEFEFTINGHFSLRTSWFSIPATKSTTNAFVVRARDALTGQANHPSTGDRGREKPAKCAQVLCNPAKNIGQKAQKINLDFQQKYNKVKHFSPKNLEELT